MRQDTLQLGNNLRAQINSLTAKIDKAQLTQEALHAKHDGNPSQPPFELTVQVHSENNTLFEETPTTSPEIKQPLDIFLTLYIAAMEKTKGELQTRFDNL